MTRRERREDEEKNEEEEDEEKEEEDDDDDNSEGWSPGGVCVPDVRGKQEGEEDYKSSPSG